LIEGQSVEPLNLELQAVAETSKWNDLPHILSGLGPASTPTIPSLISLIEHPDSEVSCQALRLLGELRLSPEVVVPALAQTLSSKNDNRRFTAATALAAYGLASRSASAALIQALGDHWGYVVINSISAIEQFAGTPEAQAAVPKLQQLLKHHDDSIRISSARTLASIQKGSGPER
jgi:HEAT repeat protein